MNSLIYILPDSIAAGSYNLDRLLDYTKILDHEECAHYWDEAQFKRLNGKIDPSDRLSQKLRRLRFAVFTDISYLDKPTPGIRVYDGRNEDVTDGLYGRFATAVANSTAIGIVNEFSCHTAVLTVWQDDRQQTTIRVEPVIRRLKDAVEWLAETRRPNRKYNPNYGKHSEHAKTVNNEKISAMTLSEEEATHALRRAIGSKGETRLVYLDAERGQLIVFSSENRKDAEDSPIYHGHHFNVSDRHEIERLPWTILKKIENIYGYKFH